MVQGALIIFLTLGNLSENREYKNTVGIDLLSSFLPFLSLKVKFEAKFKERLSVDFNLTTSFLFISPEVGIREYLGKGEFDGFYLYQGINGIIFSYNNITKLGAGFAVVGGYKYIAEEGFTIDPFLGLRLGFGASTFIPISRFFHVLPVIGLYMGYSW